MQPLWRRLSKKTCIEDLLASHFWLPNCFILTMIPLHAHWDSIHILSCSCSHCIPIVHESWSHLPTLFPPYGLQPMVQPQPVTSFPGILQNLCLRGTLADRPGTASWCFRSCYSRPACRLHDTLRRRKRLEGKTRLRNGQLAMAMAMSTLESFVDSMFWDISTNGQALRLMIYQCFVVQCYNQLSAHFSETYL